MAGAMTAEQTSGELCHGEPQKRWSEADASQGFRCGPGEPPVLPADPEDSSAEAANWDWDWTFVEAAATDWD